MVSWFHDPARPVRRRAQSCEVRYAIMAEVRAVARLGDVQSLVILGVQFDVVSFPEACRFRMWTAPTCKNISAVLI